MPTPTRCETCGLAFFAEEHPDACPRCKASRLAPPRLSSRPPPALASLAPERRGSVPWGTLGLLVLLLALAGGGVYTVRFTSLFQSDPFGDLGLTDEEEARLNAVVGPTLERIEQHPRAPTMAGHDEAGLEHAILGLATLGFRRLSEPELLRWTELRIRMAEQSPAVCAGMWSGGATVSDGARAMAQLPDEDLRDWFALSEHAIVAELDATTPFPDHRHVLVRGLRRIGSRLPRGRREAFFAALGQQLGPVESCEMTLTLLRGVNQLEPDIRLRFLRSLAGTLYEASGAARGQTE